MEHLGLDNAKNLDWKTEIIRIEIGTEIRTKIGTEIGTEIGTNIGTEIRTQKGGMNTIFLAKMDVMLG